MTSPSYQPGKKPEPEHEETTEIEQAKARREENLSSIQTTTIAEQPSMGETLLPLLFAAMETCWVDAIVLGLASLGLFQSHAPLIPLWAPFIFLAGSQWILSQLERRSARTEATISSSSLDSEGGPKNMLQGSPWFIAFVCFTLLFVIWLTLYTQAAYFFDPRWLFSALSDLLSLNIHAFHLFTLVALSIFFCWRGANLVYRDFEPSHFFNALRLGLVVIILVVLIRAAQASTSTGAVFNDDVILLLLIPIFLFLSLAAHGLARVAFVRRQHPRDVDNGIATQERAILVMIGVVGVALLAISLLTDALASPTMLSQTFQFFASLREAYTWFVNGVAAIALVLFTPFFLLFSWFTSLFPPALPHLNVPGQKRGQQAGVRSPGGANVLEPFLAVALPILFALVVYFFIRWALRRRRRVQLVANRRPMELHESLWSWALFWMQFKALLLSIFGRFWRKKATAEDTQPFTDTLSGEPAVRSIREIYRALLKRAAVRGYPRKKDETPYEFRQRLDENTPLASPQLAFVTEVYTGIRYGDIVPDETEVVQAKQEWATLEQKWREVAG